ncbi:MAG: putative glycoside hydrolase [Evtepia gabavorous]
MSPPSPGRRCRGLLRGPGPKRSPPRPERHPRPVHRGPGLLPSGQCSGPGGTRSLPAPGQRLPWLDESRQGWLDPAQPQVQSYLIGLCRELAQLGFDEILLTDCGFPTQGDLDSLRAVEEKEETLETFCRQLQGALADTPVTLSVMGQRDSVTADPVSGQTTALLATFGRVWTQAEDQEALAAFDPVVLPAVS